MMPPTQKFEDFTVARSQIADALEKVAACYSKLEARPRAELLLKQKASLLNDTFKVLVIGEFKRGKSTLINSMLGQKVLPAKVPPCTAVITRVRYGDKRSATLVHRDRSPDTTIDLEANPAALADHLTIKTKKMQADGGTSEESPYLSADVFFPLELCRLNVEIVDSPGLNENKVRTEVTREFLFQADALMLVLSCEMFLSESEVKFLETELKDRDLRDVFFVCNRYDAVRDSQEDLEDLQIRLKRHIEPLTKGQSRVFFVAARDALEGRLNGNPQLLASSNLLPLEAALEAFLATERGRVKLGTPYRICNQAVTEALVQLLPQRENLVMQPVEQLKSKLESERPRLAEAQKQHERILRTVERRSDAMILKAEGALRTFISEIETGLAVQSGVGKISNWQALFNGKAAAQEIATGLENWVSEETHRWEKTVLAPVIENEWKSLLSELNEQAEEFMANLESIKTQLNFEIKPSTQLQPREDEASALNRMFGAGMGLLLSGPGGLIEGAALGTGRMAKGAAINLAAAFALSLAGLGLPVIAPVIIGLSVVRTFMGAQSNIAALRKTVSEKVATELRAAYPKMEAALRDQVVSVSKPFAAKLEERMTTMVDEIRGQVQSVIRDREQQQQSAEQQLAEIKAVRATLCAVQNELHDVAARLSL